MSKKDDEKPEWYRRILEREGLVHVKKSDPVEEYARKAKHVFESALARKSPETIRAYQRAVKSLGKFMDLEDPGVTNTVQKLISLSRIDADILLQSFISDMEDNELSPNTISQRIAGVKFYVHQAKRVGWVDWEVEVEVPKIEKVKDTRGPTPEEFKEILRVTNELEGGTATRNRLMVYMLSFMGLRIDSVLSIDLEHIDIRRKEVMVRWKGKKHRVLRPIPTSTMTLMKSWIKERGGDSGPLFPSYDLAEKGDGRLTRRSGHRIIQRLGVKAGIFGLHPHAFRHFAATVGLDISDGNRHKVRKLTGHESDKTLNIYDDERSDEAREMSQMIEDFCLGE